MIRVEACKFSLVTNGTLEHVFNLSAFENSQIFQMLNQGLDLQFKYAFINPLY